mmetsp:Transcript_112535/g.363390  ORF Transcript_112535/g.363390 Transcript_112535/m.363390 type:complete len:407 (+) Transcript_112535:56-1276(+)
MAAAASMEVDAGQGSQTVEAVQWFQCPSCDKTVTGLVRGTGPENTDLMSRTHCCRCCQNGSGHDAHWCAGLPSQMFREVEIPGDDPSSPPLRAHYLLVEPHERKARPAPALLWLHGAATYTWPETLCKDVQAFVDANPATRGFAVIAPLATSGESLAEVSDWRRKQDRFQNDVPYVETFHVQRIASWRPAARWALAASTSTGFASPASPWAPRPRGTSDCASATTSRRWRRWLAAARGRVTAGRRRVRWRGSARCRFARIPWRPTTGVTPGVTSRGSRGTAASPGNRCKAPCPSRRTLDSGSSRKARTSLQIIVGASRLAAALALGPRVSLRAEARRLCSHRPQICSWRCCGVARRITIAGTWCMPRRRRSGCSVGWPLAVGLPALVGCDDAREALVERQSEQHRC